MPRKPGPTEPTILPRRSGRAASAPVFRYTAVVSGHGEILPIFESIGRRYLRAIDPRSRMGRRLLASGQVALWCESLARGERPPVVRLLEQLMDEVRRQRDRRGGSPRWDRDCGDRLKAIERWRAFYASGPGSPS